MLKLLKTLILTVVYILGHLTSAEAGLGQIKSKIKDKLQNTADVDSLINAVEDSEEISSNFDLSEFAESLCGEEFYLSRCEIDAAESTIECLDDSDSKIFSVLSPFSGDSIVKHKRLDESHLLVWYESAGLYLIDTQTLSLSHIKLNSKIHADRIIDVNYSVDNETTFFLTASNRVIAFTKDEAHQTKLAIENDDELVSVIPAGNKNPEASLVFTKLGVVYWVNQKTTLELTNLTDVFDNASFSPQLGSIFSSVSEESVKLKIKANAGNSYLSLTLPKKSGQQSKDVEVLNGDLNQVVFCSSAELVLPEESESVEPENDSTIQENLAEQQSSDQTSAGSSVTPDELGPNSTPKNDKPSQGNNNSGAGKKIAAYCIKNNIPAGQCADAIKDMKGGATAVKPSVATPSAVGGSGVLNSSGISSSTANAADAGTGYDGEENVDVDSNLSQEDVSGGGSSMGKIKNNTKEIFNSEEASSFCEDNNISDDACDSEFKAHKENLELQDETLANLENSEDLVFMENPDDKISGDIVSDSNEVQVVPDGFMTECLDDGKTEAECQSIFEESNLIKEPMTTSDTDALENSTSQLAQDTQDTPVELMQDDIIIEENLAEKQTFCESKKLEASECDAQYQAFLDEQKITKTEAAVEVSDAQSMPEVETEQNVIPPTDQTVSATSKDLATALKTDNIVSPQQETSVAGKQAKVIESPTVINDSDKTSSSDEIEIIKNNNSAAGLDAQKNADSAENAGGCHLNRVSSVQNYSSLGIFFMAILGVLLLRRFACKKMNVHS